MDTASAYGQAEQRIGKIKNSENFHVINKIKFTDTNGSCKQPPELTKELRQSLCNLNRNAIDTLLIHDAWNIPKDCLSLYISWLNEIKRQGLVNKIGLSIYEEKDLLGFDLENLDIVQVPLSIYDQRMVENKFLDKAKSLGVEIHVRSIFLQGLILSKAHYWPSFIEQKWIKHHLNFIDYSEHLGVSQLDLAMQYIKSIMAVDGIVIGIDNKKQLEDIVHAFDSMTNDFIDFAKWGINDEIVVDPRRWPKHD